MMTQTDVTPFLQQITAAGAIIGGIATVSLALIAYVQLRGLKSQLRIQREQEQTRLTLEACTRYETNPLLKGAMKRVWQASGHGKNDQALTDAHLFDVITILNYRDGIAAGVKRGIYSETDVRLQLKDIVEKCVSALLLGETREERWSGKRVDRPEHYAALMELYTRWFDEKAASGAKVRVFTIFNVGPYVLTGAVRQA
ncbi:MAG TPA: hypothetical protein VHG93_00200 [Longimicrobium sp.]|nr:hypothetical protein [Longimicrobium sp.]